MCDYLKQRYICVNFQFYMDIIADIKAEKEKCIGYMTYYSFSKKRKKKNILATAAEQCIKDDVEEKRPVHCCMKDLKIL